MSGLLSGSLLRLGALSGLIFALGAILVFYGHPRQRKVTLLDRIGPYLRDTPIPSRLLSAPTASTSLVSGLVGPYVDRLGAIVERVLGGSETISRRQQRAGQAVDVPGFRASQVTWGFVAAAVATVLGVTRFVTAATSPVLVLMMIALSFVAGVLARDYWLSEQAKRREERMLVEFPTIAEMLALSVSAGEGTVGALERVCSRSKGELAGELSRSLNHARSGASLTEALQGLADRTGLPSLARFVDGIVIAVERGTPLADVLRAQAQDVREDGRRHLMEEGGKREIAMMVPIVFLVLPVTVLFAIFPGFQFMSFQL